MGNLSSIILLPLFLLCGWSLALGSPRRVLAEARFSHIEDSSLNVSGDFRGVALGDAGENTYLYLTCANEQGRLVLWDRDKSRSEEIRLPLPFEAGAETGAAWIDFDGDEDLDLFVSRYYQENLFYKNEGDGEFVEVADVLGLSATGPGQGIAWGDYDLDGDLDLYVVNNGTPNLLYRNEDDSFVEVSGKLGVNDDGDGSGAVWTDHDLDGDLDLYVVNYGQANRFYQNGLDENIGELLFKEVGRELKLDDDGRGMGATWVDFDGDGDLELSLAQFDAPNRLFEQGENGKYSDIASQLNIADKGLGQQAVWGDYNGDGNLDVYAVNGGDESNDLSRLYKQVEDQRFINVATEVGLVPVRGGAKQARGAVWWDMDDDGDLDLYVINRFRESKIFRNEGMGRGFSLSLHNQEGKNRHGTGARVDIWQKGKRTIRHMGLSANFLSQESQRIYWGPGVAGLDSLMVYWPDEGEQTKRPQDLGSSAFITIEKEPDIADILPKKIDSIINTSTQSSRIAEQRPIVEYIKPIAPYVAIIGGGWMWWSSDGEIKSLQEKYKKSRFPQDAINYWDEIESDKKQRIFGQVTTLAGVGLFIYDKFSERERFLNGERFSFGLLTPLELKADRGRLWMKWIRKF
jgi:enediyne biosynthesis protein E4